MIDFQVAHIMGIYLKFNDLVKMSITHMICCLKGLKKCR